MFYSQRQSQMSDRQATISTKKRGNILYKIANTIAPTMHIRLGYSTESHLNVQVNKHLKSLFHIRNESNHLQRQETLKIKNKWEEEIGKKNEPDGEGKRWD